MAILETIRSYLQCGNIYISKRTHNDGCSRKPTAIFHISGMNDLASVIVPHFDKYSLRAKKAGDFKIWKEGVAILVQMRGLKWTEEKLKEIESVIARLREYRKSAFLPSV